MHMNYARMTFMAGPAYDASRTVLSSLLKAPSSRGQAGSLPRSTSTRCAVPKPLNTTALTPWGCKAAAEGSGPGASRGASISVRVYREAGA